MLFRIGPSTISFQSVQDQGGYINAYTSFPLGVNPKAVRSKDV